MIRLAATTFWARWFSWSCDYLPGASIKNGTWHLENGTTLCHLFWASLWVPLMCAAVIGFVLLLVVGMHVEMYQRLGTPGLLVPIGFVLGMAVAVAVFVLVFIVSDKSGFFKLLWHYLKGLKDRVCPFIRFE